MQGLLTTAAVLLAAILLYRFRQPILAALARFDARNRERLREEFRDRHDPLAHYKHTARIAAEQVEEVGTLQTQDARTGLPVILYLFEGETFPTRFEAERARQQAILKRARGYYAELPRALRARKNDELG